MSVPSLVFFIIIIILEAFLNSRMCLLSFFPKLDKGGVRRHVLQPRKPNTQFNRALHQFKNEKKSNQIKQIEKKQRKSN